MIRDVIDDYHALLTDAVAARATEQLNADLLKRKCYFGNRPLCTVLRPHFYKPEQWDYLKRETELLLRAFSKAHNAAMSSSTLRAQLNLEMWEEALFNIDIGFEFPWTTSRLDSFYDLDTGSLKFMEYNAETPAGMGYEDQLAKAFLELEPIKMFGEQYDIRGFLTFRSLFESLLEIYRQFGGKNKPQIAIVDWQDVPTLNEHMLCQEYFEEQGVKTQLADPRALEYRNDALWHGDFRVDLIYKRVLCSELIQRMGFDNPIVRAVRDKAVAMSNAFSAKLMAKKASFALVSDELNAHLFDDQDLAAIEAHIPWTRRVEERKTLYHGEEIDLVPFIAENQDNLVLKPNDEYGGKGVIIGWEADPELWAATIRDALVNPYVVQEKIPAAIEDFPSCITGKLEITPRLVDADPFIFFGRTASGCMTRLSTTALLNVTAGGGSIAPTFVVHKKN
jgi:uncharacterized circularly permuted ATP-grasp superfamily protein